MYTCNYHHRKCVTVQLCHVKMCSFLSSVLRYEFFDPFLLPTFQDLITIFLPYDPDGEVPHGMSTLVEVFRYWGFFLVFDLRSVVVEAFVQSPCCPTNILVIVAILSFNQMDCTLGLAGSRCAYFVGFFGVRWAFDSFSGVNVFAGLTPCLVAWAGSSRFCDGNNRLNLCTSGGRRYFRVGVWR